MLTYHSAAFNGIPYTSPKVPTLYTVMSSGSAASNASIYGDYTNSFVLEKDDVVEIIMNNDDTGKHPFHLHGHNFQVLVRGDEDLGHYDPNNHTAFPAVPMRRDVLMVRPQSYFVIRFKADNPGVWLFHCHIEWHMDSGLVSTMIEAPATLQETLTIPADHYAACVASNTSYVGNAAGDSENFFDLTGEPAPPGPLPAGFTPKGIVAMTFSIISALLGIAMISWYGAAPLTKKTA